MKEDLVTIIMSTYKTNVEMLNESINSILKQNYKNIEFIIVCDGDINEYNYIKKTFHDKRIKLLLNEKNCGLPYSLNLAIENSKGKYIARMDSDDVSILNRISIQKKFMDNNKDIEICGMYTKCFGDSTKKIKYKFIKPKEIEIQMLYIPVLVHPSVMFRRNFFKNKNLYNEDFKCSQDYELWARTVNQKNIAIIPKIGLYYRIHKSQIGQKKRKIQLENTKLIYEYGLRKVNLPKNDSIKLFQYLYGFELLNKKNYIIISNLIDRLIVSNDYFEDKCLKKIIYNRYMIQMIKSKLYIETLNKAVLRKIYNFENFKYFVWKIFGR